MAQYTVTATIELTFDSEDGLVRSESAAREEMMEYLSTGPLSPWYFEIEVSKSE